jgi:DNA-binding MarR family transcriptional regulator
VKAHGSADSLESLMSASVGLTARALLASTDADELTLTQWRSLVVLSESEAPMRVSDLGRSIGASLPSTSRLVSRLRGRGVLILSPSEADRRVSLISLTDRGREVVAAVRRVRHGFILAAIKDLDVFDDSFDEKLALLADTIGRYELRGQ